MNEARRAAIIHALLGAVKAEDVPMGTYDIGAVRVVITLPDDAQVVRESGTAGNGFDDAVTRYKEVPMAAIAMFLKQKGVTGAACKRTWKALIKRVLFDAFDEPMPSEALEALEEVQAENEFKLRGLKKTSARRLNIKSALVEVYDPVAA